MDTRSPSEINRARTAAAETVTAHGIRDHAGLVAFAQIGDAECDQLAIAVQVLLDAHRSLRV